MSGQSVGDGIPGEHSTATSGEESTLQLEIVTFAHAHRGACAYVCKLIHPVQENLLKSKGRIELPVQNYLSVILFSLILPLW